MALNLAFYRRRFSSELTSTLSTSSCLKQKIRTIPLDGKIVKLQIWDTAGQERFQSLGVAFYRGADACILVYDITNPNSFEKLNKWRSEFINQANISEPDNFPFVVIGNKVDKEGQRAVPKSNAALLISTGSLSNSIGNSLGVTPSL